MEFLRGTWSVERTITDSRSGSVGSFVGTATFAPTGQDGELAYDEAGEIAFNGHRGPATRRLIYRGNEVFFADGRPFYVLDLVGAEWQADHPCGRDAYHVTGRITGPDSFTEHWHAAGPAKNYDLETTFTRRPSA